MIQFQQSIGGNEEEPLAVGKAWRAASAHSPAAATCALSLADPAAQGKATVPKQAAALQGWRSTGDRKITFCRADYTGESPCEEQCKDPA